MCIFVAIRCVYKRMTVFLSQLFLLIMTRPHDCEEFKYEIQISKIPLFFSCFAVHHGLQTLLLLFHIHNNEYA